MRLGSAGPLREPFRGLPMEAWRAPIPDDLQDYIDTCERGAFYGEVADTWGLPNQSPRERNEVKRLVFRRILFGRVRRGRRHWEAFRHRWPTVATALELIKRNDHGTSARACQRIESRLMIEGVVERFRCYHPTTFIQTIHDSLLVVPDAVEIAREAITRRVRVDRANAVPERERTAAKEKPKRKCIEQHKEHTQGRGKHTNTNTSSQFAFVIAFYYFYLAQPIVAAMRRDESELEHGKFNGQSRPSDRLDITASSLCLL